MGEFKLSYDNLYPDEEDRKDNTTNSFSSRSTNSIKSDTSSLLSYIENPLALSTTSRSSRTSNKSLFCDDRASRSISSRGTSTRLMLGYDQRSPLSAVDEGREAMTGKDIIVDVDTSRFSIYNNIDKFSTATSNILRKKFIRPRKPYVLTNLSTGESYTMIRPSEDSITISRLQVHEHDPLLSTNSSSVINLQNQHPSSSSSSSTKKSSNLSLLLPNSSSSSSSSNSTKTPSHTLPSNNLQQKGQQQNISPKDRASLPTQFHSLNNEAVVKNKHNGVSSNGLQSPLPKKLKISNISDKSKYIPVIDPHFNDWTWSHEWKQNIDHSKK